MSRLDLVQTNQNTFWGNFVTEYLLFKCMVGYKGQNYNANWCLLRSLDQQLDLQKIFLVSINCIIAGSILTPETRQLLIK